MDNKISPEAIERFFNNQCDVQEATQVADYLKNAPQEVLNQYLTDQQWQGDDNLPNRHLPQNRRDEMWEALAAKTVLYKRRKVLYLKRIVSAACMAGLLITGYYFYSQSGNTDSASSKEVATANEKIIQHNTTEADKHIQLPDGTKLILTPGASVYYYGSFKNKRDLFLTGTAFFSVIHDSAHPFVVMSNGFAVRDIGTKFWIENKNAAQTLTVKLEEGLVVVHCMETSFQMKDVYLKPGQKLVINKSTGSATVDLLNKEVRSSVVTRSAEVKKEAPTGKTTWTNAAYTFSKTSLEEVFRKLETRYKVTIIVEDPQINQMQFTGKVMYTDSLASLINVICAINNLSNTRLGDTIYIKN